MQLVQLKTQDTSLVMDRETARKLLDLLDSPEHMFLSYSQYPFIERLEAVDNSHAMTWYEWTSLKDKFNWEGCLEII